MSRRQSTVDIQNVEEFSVAFATAVTEPSDNSEAWIAKKGKNSIFAILNEVFPQASWLILHGPHYRFSVCCACSH
jgi:hypothetical protein